MTAASGSDVVFLRGKKTILYPLDPDRHLEKVTRWINDPELRQYLAVYLPKTMGDERRYFEEVTASKDQIVCAIDVVSDEGRVFIGMMGLHDIKWKDRLATTGALIGEGAYRGQGYGTDAKMSLLWYAFYELGCNSVCSHVFQSNLQSRAYLEKTGYRVDGVLREYVFKNGRFWNVLAMSILRSEFEPVWERYQRTGSVK